MKNPINAYSPVPSQIGGLARTILVIFGIGVCLVLNPSYSFSIQVDIEDISDNKYFQAVHKELSTAEELGIFKYGRAEYRNQIIKVLIRIIQQYGEENVANAVKKVSSMRPDNPLRNIGYLVGILKHAQ